MIGITGIARSGKDTLGLSLLKMINKSSTKKAKIYSIANIIKKDLNSLIKKQFGFSAFTEDTNEKNLIRPILVEYGEAMKTKYGENIWLDKLIENINFKKSINFNKFKWFEWVSGTYTYRAVRIPCMIF